MQSTNPFQRAEEEFFRLKGQLATGRITRAQFDAALRAMVVQDAEGHSWTLDADSGKWIALNVPPQSEIQRMPEPPRSEAARMPLPPPRTPPPEAFRTPSYNRWLPCAILGSGFALILAVIIGVILFSTRGDTVPPESDVSQQVRSLVASIDPEQPETLYVPEELVGMGRAPAPVLLDLIDSPKMTTRWAAFYYFSRMAQPEDIPILAKGLNDSSFSLRTTVAATLFNLRDYRGLAILQEAAQSNQEHAFSEPPEPLSAYARPVLAQLAPKNLSDTPSVPPGQWGSGVLAAPLPIPDLDCAVSMSGCTANVTLNLQFTGDGAREDLATLWALSIKSMWESKLSANCCRLHLTMNTLVGGDERADYTRVIVHHITPGKEFRARATIGGSANSNNLRAWLTDQDTSGYTAAHEAGHLLGVDDEYKDDANGVSHPVGAAAAEIAAGAGNLMGWSDINEKGTLPTIKTRHVNAVLSAYGVQCPASCVDQCPSRPTPTNTPTRTPTSTSTPTPTKTATLTATPDLSWIDPYVDSIANQLLTQGYSPVAVAVVTDDLRNCLIDAVKGGLDRNDALAHCAKVIKNVPTPTPTLTSTPTSTAVPPNLPRPPSGPGGPEPPSGPPPPPPEPGG